MIRKRQAMEDDGMGRMKWILGIFLISAALCGCGENGEGRGAGPEEANVPAGAGAEIEVLKDGSIVETITEEFAKEYYDAENLEDMLMAEVEDFNRNLSGGSVTVEAFESADGKLTVEMKYPSPEAYSAYNTDTYNHKTLFVGTIVQAKEAGYTFDVPLTDAKGEKTIGEDEILGMESSKIVIAESPSQLKIPGKILYIGENVEALGKNKAAMWPDENGNSLGKYYVVYK